MTVLFELKNISKEYGYNKILDNINIKVNYGDRIGLVGNNGSGKTTLANIIYGTESYKGGILWNKGNVAIGYMKQSVEYVQGFDALSGGEKTKKLLSDILYGNYELIILDEPTNHLDYQGVSWLIDSIDKFTGTVIMISHDRHFLDQCAEQIIELENCTVKKYVGNYTDYRSKKQKEYIDQMHQYIEQEKVKERINNQMQELRCWSDKAHRDSRKNAIASGNKLGGKEYNRVKAKKRDKQIKSKLRKLEKIDIQGIDKPIEEEKIQFEIEQAKKIGSVVVRADNIAKTFKDKIIFKDSSFYIKQYEKIGLYGLNGCGKTTLIKAILGEIIIDGELYVTQNKNIGYISQDTIGLDDNKRIIELFNVQNNHELGELRTKLSLLGFSSEDINKKISCLSLGERMKIKILIMIQERCDILILDEPTNHIDLHVREQLEEALIGFNGTIILVTHDRYMLEKVCNKLLVFKNNKIIRYEYGIKEYLDRQKAKNEEDVVLVLENRKSFILSKLSQCVIGSEEYNKWDFEFRELIKKIKKL